MNYTYVLKSQIIDKFYVGQTQDLKRRILEHNHGKNNYTRGKGPWELIYYE